jgi:pSer/pThr/pTyr-binding forkhead associated (FHA) protein
LAALAWQPTVATIEVQDAGPVVIRRSTATVVVRLDGKPLGVAPVELREGSQIDFGGCHLTFESDESAVGHDGRDRDVLPSSSARVSARTGAKPEVRPARLVNVRTAQALPLSGRRVVIGRDASCDLVMAGKGVSRRHASISPVHGGYLLRDESSNGTVVNGARVAGTYLLDHGDVLHMDEEELRFELEGAESRRPAATTSEPTALLDRSQLLGGAPGALGRLTASLEIIRGPFAGASFHIDRSVCAIGRGEQSDVRIRDESVSTTHATLLRKGTTWYVVDLRSANGTFVDGSRIAGERELPPGATLGIGSIEMTFRSFDAGVEVAAAKRKSGGALRWLSTLWRRTEQASETDD